MVGANPTWGTKEIEMKLVCWLVGHDWSLRGWTSDKFDLDVPSETPIANIWSCVRCNSKVRTYETAEQVQARFDDYREKYGDAVVYTHEFHPPKPPL